MSVTVGTKSYTAEAPSYVTRAGDTLWGIAQRLYGTGLVWTAIGDHNGLTDCRALPAGLTLNLP